MISFGTNTVTYIVCYLKKKKKKTIPKALIEEGETRVSEYYTRPPLFAQNSKDEHPDFVGKHKDSQSFISHFFFFLVVLLILSPQRCRYKANFVAVTCQRKREKERERERISVPQKEP